MEQEITKAGSSLLSAAEHINNLLGDKDIHIDDYRVGKDVEKISQIIAVDSDAQPTLRELLTVIKNCKLDEEKQSILEAHLVKLLDTIVELNNKSLQAELISFLSHLKSRNLKLFLMRTGWDGGKPHTLQKVGDIYNITRERVRQIEKLAYRSLRWEYPPYTPTLDQVLAQLINCAPCIVDKAERELVASGLVETQFCIESILKLSRYFLRNPNLRIENLPDGEVLVSAHDYETPSVIRQIGRRSVEHWGVSTIEDICAQCAQKHNIDVTPEYVKEIIQIENGFEWLDQHRSWFWISSVQRNRLLNQIDKITSIAPIISIIELRSGVGRHYRMKGFSPPSRVLQNLCRSLPHLEINGDKIIANPPPDKNNVLSDIEREMSEILTEYGPLLLGTEFEAHAVKAGINSSSFYVSLGYSPIFARYANQVYGLRGADINPGAAEALIPTSSKTSKVLIDHGWARNGDVWIAYKINQSTLRSGVVSIPSALSNTLKGEYELVAEDGQIMGRLVIKDYSAWGIGPFFRRRGGEPGDIVVLVIKQSTRKSYVYIGDTSLIERFLNGIRETIQ